MRDVPRRLAIIAIGTLLALAVLEPISRQIFFCAPAWDPVLGRIPKPGTAVRWTSEGFGTSHWTVHGIRRPAPPAADQPNVVVLGDSYTEALMVDDEDVFTQRAEVALRSEQVPLQLLNLGRSGQSAADYVARADLHRELFASRWTVIQLRPNDLGAESWSAGRTHFIEHEDGSLGVEVGPEPAYRGFGVDALTTLRQRVNLFNFALARFLEFREALRQEPPLFRAVSSAPAPQPAATEYPIERELDLLARSYDGHVTFLYLSVFEPDGSAWRRDPMDARLEALCRARRWSCVRLEQAFAGFVARRAAPYGFANTGWNVGHMNAAGHRAAGDLLAAELARLWRDGLL